jgi:phytoene dehydrogenase-like protein
MTVDAVVIGAGPNGLVAANLLADAGWTVTVLEAQEQAGGAVASDSSVREGWVHDTFSSFYPLAAVSRTIRGLELERHGLEWTHAPAVVGTPFADGSWALMHRDRDATAAGLDDLCPGDGDAWLEMCRGWDRIGEQVVGALLSPFPPVRHGAPALARLRGAGGLGLVRHLVGPLRQLADDHFRGEAPKILLGGNAAHADAPLDGPGSAVMGWLLCMVGQHLGFPVPRGGAGSLAQALVDRFTSNGGELRLGTRVDEVLVRGGRAVGVRTEDGDVVTARRAVVADVTAPALYGGLVAWQHLPARVRRGMQRFAWDPATLKVDWALDGPVPWKSPPPEAPGTVHIAESVDELVLTGAQISAGQVPSRPFLLVGQMAEADPTRAPAGAESLWAYTHLPHHIKGDAAGEGVTGDWAAGDAERFADRMQARIERHAPGFGDRVLDRRVLSPHDLESRDANLVDGAINGGTAGLQQQLVFRPVPGLGRAETPVRGLYLGSASAHPGGGVHGACGANAARAALWHARTDRLVELVPWGHRGSHRKEDP